MGYLTSAHTVITSAMATAMMPPPPPDITRWCEENIEFDERSPMPGPFDATRFAFLRNIHSALSPEHPCREVTVRGSAQIGKTVSLINPTLGAWHAYTPLDSLVVHPTTSAATEWVNNKWKPMRRQATSLKETFGGGLGGDQRDNTFNQETLSRNGSLKVASAGSPADLTGTSRRLVIMDDVAKFDMTDKGDPEALAESRASGFEDAKILRISTALIKGTCRISAAYARSDQRLFHLPCPHCGNFAPLTWENFEANIDPERLGAACFSCDANGCIITHGHKEQMIAHGRWVAQNPRGDHPGFHIWRAYAPQRDWASIAVEYARLKGWTRIDGNIEGGTKSAEAETEQTFWNDVLGLPYETASDAPDWEALRDRTEKAQEQENGLAILDRGVLPSLGVLVTAGVDCQDDRIEVHVKAFGRTRQRWTVDYIVIPHHISTEQGRDALDAIMAKFWRTELGLAYKIDCLAIDTGAYTDDVWNWAKRYPSTRVLCVKGSSSQNGPFMVPMKFERRKDGKAKRFQKRGFILNVSMMKGNFYAWLRQTDPSERGFCHFARGLGDEFYRMITSEVKILIRSRTGTTTAKWELAEPGRRNEALDCELYAEAAARRHGWASMTDDQWDALEAERGAPAADSQADLFDNQTVSSQSKKKAAPKRRSLSEVLNTNAD